MTTTKTNPLIDAADYIGEVGWCRGDWYRPDGKACLAGAIGVVTGALVPLTPAARERNINRFLKRYDWADREEAEHEAGDWFRWSEDKRKLDRYTDALSALAVTINTGLGDEIAQRVQDQLSWGALPPEEAPRVTREIRKNLAQATVVTANDEADLSGAKRKYKTTKAKAIKLLRQAAEVYAG